MSIAKNSGNNGLIHRLSRPLAAGFVVAFLLYFFTQELYNSASDPKNRITRLDLLIRCTLLDEGAPVHGRPPVNPFVDLLSRIGQLHNLNQRIVPLLLAMSIVLTAAALGDLLLGFARMTWNRAERVLYAYAIGMGLTSLGVLILGCLGVCNRWTVGLSGAIIVGCWFFQSKSDRSARMQKIPSDLGRLPWIVGIVVTPFVVFALLASLLPTPDFDALAYHLLGPKEWFQRGAITFLPHNVYTAFPFLTEMFAYLGMVTADDWFLGGLVGQSVLWSFGPAGGLAVAVLANRIYGPRTACWASLIYLSTPWIYRLSSIPYVEGALLFFTVVALDAATRQDQSKRWILLAGMCAGFAFGCKYPALFTTVAPVGLVVAWRCFRQRSVAGVVALSLGLLITTGPWLIRNIFWTGNPVYPLASGLFQSPYWSQEQAERFTAAHRSTNFDWASIQRYLLEIPAKSDWQTALAFAFAPLALLGSKRKESLLLWLFVGYLFVVFWGLTHRLDRFWLPLQSFVTILAGAGVAWLSVGRWKLLTWLAVTLTMIHNLAYCTVGLCGIHVYTADLAGQRQSRVNVEPAVRVANSSIIPENDRVLFIGYAAVYYADRPFAYNTVFDLNLLLKWVMDPQTKKLRDPDEIRREFFQQDIDFIIVDWNWIEIYRSPGNYGYPEAVNPALFRELVRQKVLVENPAVGQTNNGHIQLFRVLGKEGRNP